MPTRKKPAAAPASTDRAAKPLREFSLHLGAKGHEGAVWRGEAVSLHEAVKAAEAAHPGLRVDSGMALTPNEPPTQAPEEWVAERAAAQTSSASDPAAPTEGEAS